MSQAGTMQDRTKKKNLFRDALLSLQRLHKRFQLLQEHGKVSTEATQCVRDALSCLRRSNDLYRTENDGVAVTTTKRVARRPPARRKQARR